MRVLTIFLFVLVSTVIFGQTDVPIMPNTGDPKADALAYEEAKMQWYQENVPNFGQQTTASLPPPSNDDYANAITIGCNTLTSGTTVDATLDMLSTPFCGTSITTGGVWYKVTATTNQMLLSTCNMADYDSKISLFEICGPELLCVGGNDDGPGCAGFTSQLFAPTAIGRDYAILVHGFFTSEGNFDLQVDCLPGGDPVEPMCVNNPIPTLSQWGIILLSIGLLIFSILGIRQRKLQKIMIRDK